jgi:hemin uptake protein HemP
MPNAEEANRALAMVDALTTSEVPKATADETSSSTVSVTHAQIIDASGLSNAARRRVSSEQLLTGTVSAGLQHAERLRQRLVQPLYL